jgi:hypothetical protein
MACHKEAGNGAFGDGLVRGVGVIVGSGIWGMTGVDARCDIDGSAE